jgi:hypothetical protein
MGIKVSKVVDINTGKKVSVEDCENGYIGEYGCFNSNCAARMTFVGTYEQRRFDKTIVVPSFFKLKSHEVHSDNCSFNTKGQVDIIVRDSDSDVIRALDEGKYEFNLQILHNPKKSALLPSTVDTTPDGDKTKTPKGKRFIRNGKATSYLNTVQQILTLRASIEAEKDLAKLIYLKYQGKKIQWNKFYFEPEEYLGASHLLTKVKKKYPLCFHGNIRSITSPTDKFPYATIKLHSPYASMVGKITPLSSINLIIKDKNIFISDLVINDEILVYGNCYVKETDWIPEHQKKEVEPNKYRFHNITVDVNYVEQVVLFKDGSDKE